MQAKGRKNTKVISAWTKVTILNNFSLKVGIWSASEKSFFVLFSINSEKKRKKLLTEKHEKFLKQFAYFSYEANFLFLVPFVKMSLSLLTCYRCCVLNHKKNNNDIFFLFAAFKIRVVKVRQRRKKFSRIVMICKHLLFVALPKGKSTAEWESKEWICFDIKFLPRWDSSLELFDSSFFASSIVLLNLILFFLLSLLLFILFDKKKKKMKISSSDPSGENWRNLRRFLKSSN